MAPAEHLAPLQRVMKASGKCGPSAPSSMSHKLAPDCQLREEAAPEKSSELEAPSCSQQSGPVQDGIHVPRDDAVVRLEGRLVVPQVHFPMHQEASVL